MMQIIAFRRVLSIFRPYWLRCLLIVLAIIAMAILGTISPVLIGMIFDRVFPYKDLHLLTLLVFALLTLPIATGLISIGRDYLEVTVGQRIMMNFNKQDRESLPFRSFPIYREGVTFQSGGPSR
jgi:ATP-binding cassette subfamily B protein